MWYVVTDSFKEHVSIFIYSRMWVTHCFSLYYSSINDSLRYENDKFCLSSHHLITFNLHSVLNTFFPRVNICPQNLTLFRNCVCRSIENEVMFYYDGPFLNV